MSQSYVKACFLEHWDKHQLKVAQMFGNRPFFEFLRSRPLVTTSTLRMASTGKLKRRRKKTKDTETTVSFCKTT